MAIEVRDLSKDHHLVCAGKRMVEAHEYFETISPALEQVHDEYPDIESETLIALWIGINCKDREFEFK